MFYGHKILGKNILWWYFFGALGNFKKLWYFGLGKIEKCIYIYFRKQFLIWKTGSAIKIYFVTV
jgi:hypothetical protein